MLVSNMTLLKGQRAGFRLLLSRLRIEERHGRGLKRKRKEPMDTVDSDDESADEELVYLPKGAKRRPIVV